MGEPHPMVEDMAKRTAKASSGALAETRRRTADYMMHRARQQADAQDRHERLSRPLGLQHTYKRPRDPNMPV